MRTTEVPQDCNPTLNGERKAVYAIDENGNYAVVPSRGWAVEEIVTSAAIEEYDLLRIEAWEKVRQGNLSPLGYHMYAKRFLVETLSQACGLFRWQVTRHLKPENFRKLTPKKLQRYADTLGISITDLKQLPPAP